MSVSFSLPEGILPEGAEVQAVQHFVEDENGNVVEVETVAETEDAEADANAGETTGEITVAEDGAVDAEFEVESFSTITLTWTDGSNTLSIECVYLDDTATDGYIDDYNVVSVTISAADLDAQNGTYISVEKIAPLISSETFQYAAVVPSGGTLTGVNNTSGAGYYAASFAYANNKWQYYTTGESRKSVSDNTVYFVFEKSSASTFLPVLYYGKISSDGATNEIKETGSINVTVDTAVAAASLSPAPASASLSDLTYTKTVLATIDSANNNVTLGSDNITYVYYDSTSTTWYYSTSTATSAPAFDNTNSSSDWTAMNDSEALCFVYPDTISITPSTKVGDASDSTSQSAQTLEVDTEYLADKLIADAVDVIGYECTSMAVWDGTSAGVSVYSIMYASDANTQNLSSGWHYRTEASGNWELLDTSQLYYVYTAAAYEDVTINYSNAKSGSLTADDGNTSMDRYPSGGSSGNRTGGAASVYASGIAYELPVTVVTGYNDYNGNYYYYVWTGWTFSDGTKSATDVTLSDVTWSADKTSASQTITVNSSYDTTNEIKLYNSYAIYRLYNVSYSLGDAAASSGLTAPEDLSDEDGLIKTTTYTVDDSMNDQSFVVTDAGSGTSTRYTFEGWYVYDSTGTNRLSDTLYKSDGSNPSFAIADIYAAYDAAKDATTTIDDIMLIASWKEETVYAVSYNWGTAETDAVSAGLSLPDTAYAANGETVTVGSIGSQSFTVPVSGEDCSVKYTFTGWTNDGGTTIYSVDDTDDSNDTFTMGISGVQLTATWETTNVYTVTYSWNEGIAPDDAVLPGSVEIVGTGTVDLTNPISGVSVGGTYVVNGVGTYTWEGWYKDGTRVDESAYANYTIEGNTEFVGHWSVVYEDKQVTMTIGTNFDLTSTTYADYATDVKNFAKTYNRLSNSNGTITLGSGTGAVYSASEKTATETLQVTPGETVYLAYYENSSRIQDLGGHLYTFSGWTVTDDNNETIELKETVITVDGVDKTFYYFVMPLSAVTISAAMYVDTYSWTGEKDGTSYLTLTRTSVDFTNTSTKPSLGKVGLELYVWNETSGEYEKVDEEQNFYFSYNEYACVDFKTSGLADGYAITRVEYTVCYGKSGPGSSGWTGTAGTGTYYFDNVKDALTSSDNESVLKIYLSKVYTIQYRLIDISGTVLASSDATTNMFSSYLTTEYYTKTASPVGVEYVITSCTDSSQTGHENCASGATFSKSSTSYTPADYAIKTFDYTLNTSFNLVSPSLTTGTSYVSVSDWYYNYGNSGQSTVSGGTIDLASTTSTDIGYILRNAADSNGVILLTAVVSTLTPPTSLPVTRLPYIVILAFGTTFGTWMLIMRYRRKRRRRLARDCVLSENDPSACGGGYINNRPSRMREPTRRGWFDG